ncbi:MAG: RHS repeat domain-containing protein, partial [bacterium]
VYDPLTSRFLSPDPYIQAPGQWLNFDRYAYAMNNPLMYNDPSGYFFKKFGNWLKKQWNEGWDALDQFATWANETPWFQFSSNDRKS